MVDSLIGRFEHLKGRPKSDEAGPLLEKIASQVKPIMKKRNWKVGTLAEFLPSNPALLGLNTNAGQRINLRLRPPGNENTFYEYDQLVLVMLHELTHNEVGPHDDRFYKLLAVLEEEFYELKRKNYSGDGFHSDGNSLSGIKRDEYAGRLAGLAAAEKRLATARKIGKGGVLGGRSTAGKTLREVLAEAAGRRIRDDKSCATGHIREVQEEVKKAQRESEGVDAIDLTHDSEDEPGPNTPQPSEPVIVKRKSPPSSPIIVSKASTNGASSSKPPVTRKTHPEAGRSIAGGPINASAPRRNQARSAPTEWVCPTCTLLNPISTRSCDACTSPRPAEYDHLESPLQSVAQTREMGVAGKGSGIGVAEGWFCSACGEGPREWDMWSCGFCGAIRGFG